jgi:hypothetical protein
VAEQDGLAARSAKATSPFAREGVDGGQSRDRVPLPLVRQREPPRR